MNMKWKGLEKGGIMIEQVYKIRHIANIRNNLVVMINNISENEHYYIRI